MSYSWSNVPAFDVNSSLLRWWENDELPSRSFYSPNVTAVSCIIRDLGDRPLPDELANQIGQREHVSAQAQPTVFDPNARAWDEDTLPANYKAPSLDE